MSDSGGKQEGESESEGTRGRKNLKCLLAEDDQDPPGPSWSRKKRPPPCAVCRRDLKGAESVSCGHLCQKCIGESASCPLCGTSLFTTPSQSTVAPSLAGLQEALAEYKDGLKTRCDKLSEGTESGSKTLLQQVYTKLYITKGFRHQASVQHEVSWMEAGSKKSIQETVIRCTDIFKYSLRLPRVVLTVGVAGAGKTFSVLKFCEDWAQGLANQELQLVVPFSFREIHLVRGGRCSLMELIQAFHPMLQQLPPHALTNSKVLFIFDGLDESRLPLDFNCEVISEVTQTTEVHMLLVNLIRGQLLPKACIWITSRPAAANQIPAWSVHRLTEVRGLFTDQQKEQYFRTRFSDEEQFNTVLSHIRTSRSLQSMSQIPVFCWITATVLDHLLRAPQIGPLPQTLTDMYAHFLSVQMQRRRKSGQEHSPEEALVQEVHPEQSPEKQQETGQTLTEVRPDVWGLTETALVLKLGRLAFKHLQTGNRIYPEDLEQVDLDLSQVSVYFGLCSEIFRPEMLIFNKPVCCFIHQSLQEFVAAIYLNHSFSHSTEEVTEFLRVGQRSVPPLSLNQFLKLSLMKSLQSPNSHLDLFVRFLHGLNLESNQRLLQGLLSSVDQSEISKVIQNLKEILSERIFRSPDRSINIFHCLMELKDQSVHQQIQDFLKSGVESEGKLSEIQCSALASMMLMSEQVLEELDLNKYNTTVEGKWRLVPAVKNCRRAVLSDCELTVEHCEVVASALSSNPSVLRELDLSGNFILGNTGVTVLSRGLRSPHCVLEVLRLSGCGLDTFDCSALASALESNPSHLRVLDLSLNPGQKDPGVRRLSAFLENPLCRLETLRLSGCGLTDNGFSALASALKSNPSHLRVLDLSLNPELEDPGVRGLSWYLSPGLEDPGVRPLSWYLSQERKDLGVRHLSDFLENPLCRLETLRSAAAPLISHRHCTNTSQ